MKVLKKIRKRNKREIYLFGKKVFSYNRGAKQKTNSDEISLWAYLERFKFVLSENTSSQFSDAYTDKSSLDSEKLSLDGKKAFLFQYWNTGEDNAPQMVKVCFKSVERYCKDLKIVRLDDSSICSYIDIPDYILEKYKSGVISKAHFSDYIRTCLLLKYGGFWCDATVYLTSTFCLEELIQSDFFMFKSQFFNLKDCNNKNIIPSFDLISVFKDISSGDSSILCGSSWFLYAKANSRILNLVKAILDEYWKYENKLINYFLFHYVLTFVIMHDEDSAEIFCSMYSRDNFNPHILQNVLYDKFDESMFSEIKKLSPIHKLTYQKSSEIEGTFLEYLFSHI